MRYVNPFFFFWSFFISLNCLCLRCFFKIEMCFENLVAWKIYLVDRTPWLPWRSIGRINIVLLSCNHNFCLNTCHTEYNIKECRRKSLNIFPVDWTFVWTDCAVTLKIMSSFYHQMITILFGRDIWSTSLDYFLLVSFFFSMDLLWIQADFCHTSMTYCMFQRTILVFDVTAVPKIQKCFFAILVEKWFYSYHWT